MRGRGVLRSAVAVVTAATAFVLWAAGCNGLSSDCDLNLTCPTSTTTTTTPPPMCNDILSSGACDSCAQAKCCQELADCKADNTCLDACLYDVWPSPPECQAEPTAKVLTALSTCFTKECAIECAPTDECNPVTNAPCPSDGTACDAAYPGVFACIPPLGTPAKLCETCDNLSGPFCGASERCHEASHQCARYCCTDADCGSGKCVFDVTGDFGQPLANKGDMVGLCLDMTGMTPACDAPATSMSNGTCVAGYPTTP